MSNQLADDKEDEIVEFYCVPNSLRATVTKFNLDNRYQLKKILEKHGIVLHDKDTVQKLRAEHTEQTCIDKYGVKTNLLSDDPELNGKSTMVEKYGVEYPYQNAELFERCLKTKEERHGDKNYNNTKKAKETCEETYGGVGFASDELRDKSRKTTEELHGDWKQNNQQKRSETCIERYGVPHYSQTGEQIEKVRATCLDEYGDEVYQRTAGFITKTRETCLEKYGNEVYQRTEGFLKKSYETRKKNGTFNTSKPEEDYYKLLVEKYGVDGVKRQYKDERYPFNCDFYLPCTDVFIELNLSQTHGEKPYDENDSDDIALLEKWKQLSEKSDYYAAAIDTWTVRDVNKIKTAQNNNLKYFYYYTFDMAVDDLNKGVFDE